jgi:phosphoglycolate phosphatase-like HAD superfamily hydrolase
VALLTGGFSEQELRAAGAAHVYESIGDLIERLDETPLAGA